MHTHIHTYIHKYINICIHTQQGAFSSATEAPKLGKRFHDACLQALEAYHLPKFTRCLLEFPFTICLCLGLPPQALFGNKKVGILCLLEMLWFQGSNLRGESFMHTHGSRARSNKLPDAERTGTFKCMIQFLERLGAWGRPSFNLSNPMAVATPTPII